MYITRYLFLIITFSFFGTTIHAQHSITGTNSVCDGDCAIYNVVNGLGGPYFWITSGALQGDNSGTEVEICWNTIGDNDIQVVDFTAVSTAQSVVQQIDVNPYPSPEIIFPLYPQCEIRDSLDDGNPNGEDKFIVDLCKTVCSGSLATYYSLTQDNSAITWEVEGGTIISESPEEVMIQWDVSGAGYIRIFETLNGCTASEYFCIEILDPLEVDIVALNGNTDQITVCLGQEVYFQGLGSENVTDFAWDFGNDTYTSGSSASITYNTAGTYVVTLFGSTECGCTNTTEYTVIVESNPGPEIMCIETVCGGDEQTYFAAESCTNYNWQISGNGTITEGGSSSDDYISVIWNTGSVGDITLSTSGCNTPLCAIPTTVQIPIINSDAVIEGPAKVCKEGYSNYSVQYYNGTNYIWNISGNGQIIDGYNTNTITVQWDNTSFSSDQSIITVSYDNCQLECGGQSEITVDLLPRFNIDLNERSCTNKETYITASSEWDLVVVNMHITDPLGTVIDFNNASQISEIFPIPGLYLVEVEELSGAYCNDKAYSTFEVFDDPGAPTELLGPTSICYNEIYNYAVNMPNSSYDARWLVRDGNKTYVYTGQQINIKWETTGPYSIEVNYYDTQGGCTTDKLKVDINHLLVSSIEGSDLVCKDDTENYTSGLPAGNSSDWYITPSDAGSIKKNGDNTVDVTWHTAGTHQLSVSFCSVDIHYDVTVNNLPTESATFPDKVCSGEMALISVPTTSGSVQIFTEDDILVSSTGTTQVSPGKYKAVVTSTAGCEQIIPIVIDSFLSPSVRVSSPEENAFCQPHPAITITALATDDGYTYDWFHDGVSMGITTPSISTSDYGDYHVVVTDQNGCTAESNIHTLYEWCTGDQPPGTCSGSGNNGPLQVGATSLTCNELEFHTKGSTFTSTTFTWDFGDPDSGADNFATGVSPIHAFTNAGYYYVFVFGNVFGEYAVDIFTVPAAPRFDYDQACVNSAVQFNNHSTFIPGFAITAYDWNFGDPSSGADNTSTDKDPTHIYSTPGTYTTTLTITGSDGCISSYQLPVEVLDGPQGEFVLPLSSCSDEGLQFFGLESDDIISYEWDFDDIASGSANTSESSSAVHTFSSNGIYNVSLSVSNIDGCITTISKPIDITSSNLSGDIIADKLFPICYKEEVTLSAPSGGNTYFWSNGKTTQDITINQAGIYSVTISDPSGCSYIPDDINVTVQPYIDHRIRAVVYEDDNSFYGINYFDSITICEGSRFDLFTSFYSSAQYTWSISSLDQWSIRSYEMPQLPIGDHDITVELTDPSTGCAINSDNFKIKVKALPNPVTINAPAQILCEGASYTLSVDSPENDMQYYWNTGATGQSITASKAGRYSVTAVNQNGCARESQGILIRAIPDANRINVGCVTACFPDTICTPFIANAYTYQWLLDGSPVNNVIGNDLIVSQAGEYQLVVANYNGCADTSEVYSIDADPNDQTITGIVFIDENMNGIWDTGEELLSDVKVEVYEGITPILTTTTDAAGVYNFDPITTTNPVVKIDTTGLNLKLTGGLFEESVDFISCVEDKMQDFPLIRNCTTVEITEQISICEGESITINNIILVTGDTYTFDLQTTAGCDSIANVEVVAYPTSNVDITTEFTCINSDDGALNITIMNGIGLQFAIDDPVNFSSSLTFNNLSAGDHTLWFFDANGCSKSIPFKIQTAPLPDMLTVTSNTCDGGNTGSVEITPVTTGNYEYSIDGVNFSTANTFSSLSAGMTTIYIMDISTNCMHEMPLMIESNPLPELNITADNTCANTSQGSITINPLTTGNYQYAVENLNFSDSLYFDNLSTGTYSIFMLEDGNCMQTYSVTIDEVPVPTLNITADDACQSIPNGQILIESIEPNLEYSFDGVNYSTDSIFTDLTAGLYSIMVRGDDGCVHDHEIEIEEVPELEVVFEDPVIDCSIQEVVLAPTLVSMTEEDAIFLWSDNSQSSELLVIESGTYDVEVSDECSTTSYSYEIDIQEIIEEQPMYFPNVFSPDNNDINDCFVPTLNPQTQIISYHITIYDRWGNKYFESNDYTECWDGTYNGQDVRAGVFVYMVELAYTYCEEIENLKKVGDITVID